MNSAQKMMTLFQNMSENFNMLISYIVVVVLKIIMCTINRKTLFVSFDSDRQRKNILLYYLHSVVKKDNFFYVEQFCSEA